MPWLFFFVPLALALALALRSRVDFGGEGYAGALPDGALPWGDAEDGFAASAMSVWSAGVDAVTDGARKVFTLPEAGAPYRAAIVDAEQRYGLPDSLLARVLYQESHFRPEIISGEVRSPAGAVGIAQFMPATAQDLGVDPLNTDQAIAAAAGYLRSLYDSLGDWARALAAYNWGIGNVRRRGLDAAPAETRAYVSDILRDVGV